ncbi:MAG: MATE family efflux transporter [Clostridia bacterium]|nr:MATE family efflux transporter [Clostridia bacterium]
MKIQLSDHFTYPRLIRFVIPSIVMMVFTSIYGVVDGLFVSNVVGKTALAAVNFIWPVVMSLGGIGFMIGTGGSAIVGQLLGEGREEKARSVFSLMIYSTLVLGIFFTVLGMFFLAPIARLLGAEGELLAESLAYGRILLAGMTAFMLQNVFQSFLVTAERPNLGLVFTVAAGCTNILMDWILVSVCELGVEGAALATILSYVVGGVIPLFYFVIFRKRALYLTVCKIDFRAIWKAFSNGFSELLSNLAMSLVGVLYNYQLLRIIGEDGVAAYCVILYVNFIFISCFIGYAVGTAPIFSFHYGAGNSDELRNLYVKSLRLTAISGAVMLLISILLSDPLNRMFVGYDEDLLQMTVRGFIIYAVAYLFSGVNIFASSFFTALGDGLTSAILSFLRTMVFQVLALFLLPIWMGEDGIWLSVVVAEGLSLVVSVIYLLAKRKRFGY